MIPTELLADGERAVMYVYADAFLICDCGEQLLLSKRQYGDRVYAGSCKCGRIFELLDNKLVCKNENEFL
jgi:hypothetical protein